MPLAKDLFLAKALNLNLAARAVSYSTVGSYWPWKVAPEWQITDDFRVRATYSRDISAPTLYRAVRRRNSSRKMPRPRTRSPAGLSPLRLSTVAIPT